MDERVKNFYGVLPCRFCGDTPDVCQEIFPRFGRWSVDCDKCALSISNSEWSEAVRLWNESVQSKPNGAFRIGL